jgi:hypothetical protein
MAGLDRLPRASFAGFEFPVKKVTITGGLRHHVHEYPHTQGGATEPLGRKLYTIKMEATFQETFRKWPKLWPETLGTLRTLFEGGEPWDLVVPSIGKISARAIDWTITTEARIRSGESTDFTFLEEFENDFLVDELVTTSTALQPISSTFISLTKTRDTTPLLQGDSAAVRDAKLAKEKAMFDKVESLSNEIFNLDTDSDLYTPLLSEKAAELALQCGNIDQGAETMSDSRSYEILEALHELHAETARLSRDSLGKNRRVETYVTPSRMGVAQVATVLFGNTERAIEILKLNAFNDALSIPSNTSIKYYSTVSAAA